MATELDSASKPWPRPGAIWFKSQPWGEQAAERALEVTASPPQIERAALP